MSQKRGFTAIEKKQKVKKYFNNFKKLSFQ